MIIGSSSAVWLFAALHTSRTCSLSVQWVMIVFKYNEVHVMDVLQWVQPDCRGSSAGTVCLCGMGRMWTRSMHVAIGPARTAAIRHCATAVSTAHAWGGAPPARSTGAPSQKVAPPPPCTTSPAPMGACAVSSLLSKFSLHFHEVQVRVPHSGIDWGLSSASRKCKGEMRLSAPDPLWSLGNHAVMSYCIEKNMHTGRACKSH